MQVVLARLRALHDLEVAQVVRPLDEIYPGHARSGALNAFGDRVSFQGGGCCREGSAKPGPSRLSP